MSLRDGSRKMSKSEASDMSRINLTDDADQIALKIRKAKTDPHPLPDDASGFQGRPEAQNLVGIFAALGNSSVEDVLATHGGAEFSQFKSALADLAVETLGPIGAEMQRLLGDPASIDAILNDGADRARAMAAPIYDEVRRIVGFIHH
jgi:tryptophanyl-tRNA synthetase